MVRSARECDTALCASITETRSISPRAGGKVRDHSGSHSARIAVGGDLGVGVGVGRSSPGAASARHDDPGNELPRLSRGQRLEHADYGPPGQPYERDVASGDGRVDDVVASGLWTLGQPCRPLWNSLGHRVGEYPLYARHVSVRLRVLPRSVPFERDDSHRRRLRSTRPHGGSKKVRVVARVHVV